MILALGVRNSLAPCVWCVVAASFTFCRSLSELPTKTTQKGNAHKSANSQTHTYPDRTQHGTTHPDHAHVKHHHTQAKRKPHPHNTPHHNPPPPNTQTQKPNQKHKTGTRGNRGDEKERKEERRREKEEEKGEGGNTKRGQGGIEPPTSSTAHAESDVHARSLEIRNASFASEQWVPFLGSQLMISSPARFSPPSVQARERFIQATRRDARPWEETTLPCCGWKI